MANDITTAPAPAQSLSIHIFSGLLGGTIQPLVDGRTLHGKLGVATKFTDWIKDRIDQHLLVEGEDFLLPGSISEFSERPPGRPTTDYHLSLDTAKHLALAERTAAGRAVRQYFIDSERHQHAHLVPLLGELREQNTLLKQQLQVQVRARIALDPKAAKILRYHALAGLTQLEKARLMGWKTADAWRKAIKELAGLGLLQDQAKPGRIASGQAALQRIRAQPKRAITEAQRQAWRENAARGRAKRLANIARQREARAVRDITAAA